MSLLKKLVAALNDAVNDDSDKKENTGYGASLDQDYDNDYDEIDESDLDSDYDEDDYDLDELESEQSDEDLAELGRNVDQLIELRQGNLTGSDISSLHSQAMQVGLSVEEFDAILNSRIEELRDAIEAGYEPRVVYRTRSIWRRCPNCGWLNSADDMYCEWCGYQLRHRAASFLVASLLVAGAHGNAKKLHSRHVKKTVKKANKGKKAAKTVKPKANRTLSAPKTKAAPAKKSLFGSSSSAAKTTDKKKSLFGSSSSTKPTDKKTSMFGSSSSKPVEKKSSLFGSSSSKPEKKKSSLLGSSSKKSKSSGGLFGGAKKSSGFGLGKKRR